MSKRSEVRKKGRIKKGGSPKPYIIPKDANKGKVKRHGPGIKV